MNSDLPDNRSRLILFNKPYAVLSQFTDTQERKTLAEFIQEKGVYPAGRLDRDSEGLLLLTDDGILQKKIAHPAKKTWKTYLVQVEGNPDRQAIEQLTLGVKLKDGQTKPAKVRQVTEPEWLWQRNPPVRFRKTVADHWLEISIREGKNRQVRRMTAAVGLPTLRLIRTQIGQWKLDQLNPGEYLINYIKPEENKKHGLDTARNCRSNHRKRRKISHGQGKKR